MIALVTGPPGAGKSYYAVRAIAQALDQGKVVATNVELAPDAPERVSGANFARRLVPGRRASAAERIRRHVLVSNDLEELFSVRLRGSGEDRGLMVLDEAHGWMNSRSWTASDRARIVTFFTQHRKLGWRVLLIAQDAEMIDKQVRGLFEYHIHLRNVKKFKVAGVPVVPFNAFLAIWQWHSAGHVIVKREMYRLGWPRRLYDTTQLTHALEGEAGGDQHLWLPRDVNGGGSAA